jgi:hypothetical protein
MCKSKDKKESDAFKYASYEEWRRLEGEKLNRMVGHAAPIVALAFKAGREFKKPKGGCMDIRTQLGEDESIDEDIKPYKQMFLGEISGVLLRPRGHGDPHICFEIISEDDGYWFTYGGGSSSYWLEDYMEVLKAARGWCESNAKPDMHEGNQCGWKFR